MTKSIVITGGSRGIGAAVARLAGKRGWSMTINYVSNEAAAQETAAAVEETGGKAILGKGSVADEGDVVRLFDAAVEAFGAVDGVVNNAGIIKPAMPLKHMSVERMRAVFEVNVLGAYLVAREAARRMAKSEGGKGGVLVNVSSIAVRLGGPGEFVDYAGSKGAIDTMTVGLSKEPGPEGIRVVAVRPGLIRTDFHRDTGKPDRVKTIAATTPAGRPGAAEEVAEAVVWVLSDAASYVSGSIIDVSGGR